MVSFRAITSTFCLLKLKANDACIWSFEIQENLPLEVKLRTRSTTPRDNVMVQKAFLNSQEANDMLSLPQNPMKLANQIKLQMVKVRFG